ncbi:MAG: protease complex subunit PrcB family protein [Bacilli bacterium]|nr:protease complex subunit PrcB family protein [Bacilli bacterium]
MDNNNNKMEYNIEESQRKKERQEKVENVKKKVSGFFDKVKEEYEDRKRAKEEAARVKAQEKAEKETLNPTPPKTSEKGGFFHKSVDDPFEENGFTHVSNGGFTETTVTNETISKPTSLKKVKRVLTPQEKRRRSKKMKKIFRNIMTIPEILAIVWLALFLKDKYVDYSKDVHQVLTYSADSYVYEIHRDNQDIKVVKSHRKECAVAPCELENQSEYEIHFGKNQMTALRVFMDIELKFKSANKSITYKDIKTEFGKKCLFGIIHNNDYFLGFNTYKKYATIEFEQMGDYNQKGYKYEVVGGQKRLSISMGEKPSSGYILIVNYIYKKGDDFYVYVQEKSPESMEGVSTIITHPIYVLSLEDAPKNIYVYNVESGEEYPNLDAPVVPNPQPSIIQNRKVTSSDVGDLAGILRDETLKG